MLRMCAFIAALAVALPASEKLMAAGRDRQLAPSGPVVRQAEEADKLSRDIAEKTKPSIDDSLGAMRGKVLRPPPDKTLELKILPDGDVLIRRQPGAPRHPAATK